MASNINEEIESILKKYKTRLVNLSSRNRSICTSKLYKKSGLDLTSLIKFDKNITTEIFELIMERKNKKIILLENINATQLTPKDEYLKKYETKEEALKIKIEDLMISSKHINNVWSNVDEIEKEKGLYELYIGFPFLEGTFFDGTPCRAPLFLFPVKLKKETKGWTLENLLEEGIQLNKNFLLAYKNLNNPKFDVPEQDEFEEIGEAFEKEENLLSFNEVLENSFLYLKKLGIIINETSFYEKFSNFKDYKKEDFEKYKSQKLNLLPYFILGQFPIASSSIYKDYEKMLESGITDLVGELLLSDNEEVAVDEFDSQQDQQIIVKDVDFISITDLDYSQEQTLKKVLDKKNLVIYGPPGTGKSQVISNIIANYMWNQKKVLLVSEKRTALDVVYKRMEGIGLSQRIAIIHDSKKDRNLLYEKIKEVIEDHDADKVEEARYKIQKISTQIDERIEKLDFLATELSQLRECGYSLRELYKFSKRSKEKFFDDFDVKKFSEMNKINLEKIEKVLEKILEFSSYDSKNFLLSYRKNFANLETKDKIAIEEKLEEVIYYFEENSYMLMEENLKKLSNSMTDYYENFKEKSKILLVRNMIDILSKIENLLEQIFYDEKEKYCENKEKILSELSETKKIYMGKHEKITMYKKEIESLEKFPEEIVYKNISEIFNSISQINNSFFLSPKKFKLKKFLKKSYRIFSVKKEFENYKIINILANNYKDVFCKEFSLSYSDSKLLFLGNIENTRTKIEKKIEILEETIFLLEHIKKEMKIESVEEIIEKLCELKNENSFIQKIKDSIILKKSWDKLKTDIEYKTVIEFLKSNKFECLPIFPEVLERELHKKGVEKRLSLLELAIEKIKCLGTSSDLSFEILEEISDIERIIIDEKNELLIKQLNELINDITKLRKIKISFVVFDKYFHKDFFKIIREKNDSNMVSKLSKLLETIKNDFPKVQNYDYAKSKLKENELVIFEFICGKQGNNQESKEYLLKKLKNSFYIYWIDSIHKTAHETINILHTYQKTKKEIKEYIKQKKSLLPSLIFHGLNSKIKSKYTFNRVENEITYKPMLEQAQRKRNVLQIRKYVEKFYENGLFELLPVWLLTPKVASEILPFSKEIFDIVLFDEASQMFVENSLPSIYRGKQIIVAGDDKQLSPTSLGIKKIAEDDDENDENFIDDSAKTERSLLDLSKLRYTPASLKYHYRSEYEELINFSNYAFYKGRLITVPNHTMNENFKPIERIKVDGIWEDRRNEKEAQQTYELLKKLLKTRNNDESIGVITFNAQQQDFIKDYLEERCSKDLEFSNLYTQELNKKIDSVDRSLFIKNIENVQGDERDIIIFSVGYAPNREGKMLFNFGTLNQEGGENRLNVAISRAKKKIYLITSIEPTELRVENSLHEGPKIFRKYLEYSKAVSNGEKEEARSILNSLSLISHHNNITFDSDFEEEVFNELTMLGLNVRTQVGDSGYKIDLAIYDPFNEKYILGIECDGATYHSSPSARERDIYRQNFLEKNGWKIHRIWSHDWWNSPLKEIEKIKEKVNYLKNNF